MRVVLEKELGTTVDQAFARFDRTPIASASIAQVYAAQTFRGDEVIVKVRRPGLDQLLQRDQDALLQAAGLLERHTNLGAGLRPTEVAREFLDGVREELDLHEELTNAQVLAAATPEGSGVRVPLMHPDLSSRLVLTEERVDGPEIGDLAALRAAGHDPPGAGAAPAARHAPPHLPRRRLPRRPPPGEPARRTRRHHRAHRPGRRRPPRPPAALGRVAAHDRDGCDRRHGDPPGARAVGRARRDHERHRARGVARRLPRPPRAGRRRHRRVGVRGRDGDVASFRAARPRWLATLGRTFITLEGTLRALDPSFSLVDEATAEMHDVLGPDLSSLSLRDAAESEVLKELPRLRRIPGRVDDLLGQAVQGRLSVRASLLSDVAVITSLVNRAVLAILAAALGLGSVLLLDGRAPGHEVTVDEVLGYTGLGIASVLTLRIDASVVRERQR